MSATPLLIYIENFSEAEVAVRLGTQQRDVVLPHERRILVEPVVDPNGHVAITTEHDFLSIDARIRYESEFGDWPGAYEATQLPEWGSEGEDDENVGRCVVSVENRTTDDLDIAVGPAQDESTVAPEESAEFEFELDGAGRLVYVVLPEGALLMYGLFEHLESDDPAEARATNQTDQQTQA